MLVSASFETWDVNADRHVEVSVTGEVTEEAGATIIDVQAAYCHCGNKLELHPVDEDKAEEALWFAYESETRHG